MRLGAGKTTGKLLTSFFKFPPEIRKIIYTTNIIEGIHRQFRKVTKTKSVFPNDTALEKMLYLAKKCCKKVDTEVQKLGCNIKSAFDNVS